MVNKEVEGDIAALKLYFLFSFLLSCEVAESLLGEIFDSKDIGGSKNKSETLRGKQDQSDTK